MNKFMIEGEVLTDPELHEGERTAYCSAIVRVEYQGSDGQQHVSVLPVKAFGEAAEQLAAIAKGGYVQARGSLDRNRRPGSEKYPPVTLVARYVIDQTGSSQEAAAAG